MQEEPGQPPEQDGIPPTEWPDEATSAPPKKANGSAGPPVLDFPVTWLDAAQLDLTSRPLVKGLIEQASFNVIFGPSGSGKSFFTADICQHIVTGQPWRGKRVRQSLVVYVASEAGASILKRFVGWRDHRLSETAQSVPLAILTRGPNLLDVLQRKTLIDQLQRLQDHAQLELGNVVFDTLSRSIPGGDENSAQDMTLAVVAADEIRAHLHAATTYVHHSGKDPEKGARGHSALFAAADLVLRVQDHCATIDKVRDGVSGERFPFSLEPIELGTDADGETVFTCLINVADHGSAPKRPPITGANQKLVFDLIHSLMPAFGQALPETSTIPKGIRAITYDELCEAAITKQPGKEAFRVREAVTTALTGLQGKGVVGVHKTHVWLNR